MSIVFLLGSDNKLISEIRWCSTWLKQMPADTGARRMWMWIFS